MDFFERIFGWSPDNGDGWFEVLLFLIPLAGLLMLWRHRRSRGQARVDRSSRPRH
jgi:uncharacterized membrane protein